MKISDFSLPAAIATKHQFALFLDEVEAVDSALTTESIRASKGMKPKDKVEIPPLVTEFFEENQLKVSNGQTRSMVLAWLRALRRTVPVMHVTFAAEPDDASLAQIAHWMRRSVHPHVMIEAGFQPGLVAGMYMRAANRVFDYSLRSRLEAQRGSLIAALGAADEAK
jgi:hypothetical protein